MRCGRIEHECVRDADAVELLKQFLSANCNRVVDLVRFGERLHSFKSGLVECYPNDFGFEFAASSLSSGISVIHGVHQEAQKFKTTTRPSANPY